jgi:hypothetical protein
MTDIADYCTYFDERYLTRGLALYASMRRHCAPFRLWVLCMSEECHRQLSAFNFQDLIPLRLTDLESHAPDLLQAKRGRSPLEYYFTCTPALMSWLLATRAEINLLTYLDADLYFFARPEVIFADMANASTLIVPHRFSKRNEDKLQWGIYNVGWVSIRRDDDGLACLAWWNRACLEWCRDVLEGDRFADQKYLDQFPVRFARVRVNDNPGVNLAPWNLDNYSISVGVDGEPLVDGKPVVFFHFHRLRRVAPWLWRTAHAEFGAPLDRQVRQLIYRPYLAEIAAAERSVRLAVSAPPLRRDKARIGSIQERLRAVGSVLQRGGGIWVIRGRPL